MINPPMCIGIAISWLGRQSPILAKHLEGFEIWIMLKSQVKSSGDESSFLRVYQKERGKVQK